MLREAIQILLMFVKQIFKDFENLENKKETLALHKRYTKSHSALQTLSLMDSEKSLPHRGFYRS